MSTNFPTAIDTFVNPTPTSDTVIIPHSTQHTNINDSVAAIEAKVGANSSVVTTTHDYKLSGITGTDKAIGATQTVTMTNKTSSSPKVIVGSDAIGDTLYNSSGATGVQTRIPVGSTGQVLTVSGGIPSWQSTTSSNTSYAADSGAANAYVVVLSPALSAYAAGVLVQFKATNANTTASTVNVNGLGVKTIKKLGGATDLASGDIATGMMVELEYDGTNFVMLNPVANAPATVVTDIQIFSTAGTTSWTKPTNAKFVEVYVIGAGGGGFAGTVGAGGAGAGGYGSKKFNATVLGSTETVVVGAGGTSGANGNPSSFGTTVLLKAGGGGTGSSSAGGGGGTANGDVHYTGGAGGSSAGTGTGGSGIDSSVDPTPRGGGGAGYDGGTPNNAAAGGVGGSFITNYIKAGGIGGTIAGTVGAAAAITLSGLLYGGVGGGGGGRSASGTTIGAGGAGNLGGGGGGGSTGGIGGDGLVYIVTYF